MDKAKKSMLSVMLSCTKNVLIAVAIFYLLILFFGFLDDQKAIIGNFFSIVMTYIVSFFAIFIPVKNFLFEHLGKIFVGWLLISIWSLCVVIKLDNNKIKVPYIFNVILCLSVPIGAVICLMVTASSAPEGARILTFICGFILSILSVIFFIVWVMPEPPSRKIENNKPKQMELFDK